jgi:FkbM family methyltransferase
MSINSFLYRRLAPWITCEFKLAKESSVRLQNKYEIASFKDVFCHPFYWQVFQWVNSAPKLVVDCGAHCGHFSILADLCFQSKFGTTDTQYILIEPNPNLSPIVQKNIKDATLEARTQLITGLLGGKRSGGDSIWINPKNYLASGLHQTQGAKPYVVPYIDLSQVIGDREVDLMKIDIEGGEFEFIPANLDVLAHVKLLFMELHEASDEKHQKILSLLKSIGLNIAAEPLEANGQQLMIFQNQMFSFCK